MAERDYIQIEAVGIDRGKWKVDTPKALKVISGMMSLALGLKGVPSFLSSIGEISSAIRKDLPTDLKVQSQGFTLFCVALTDAIVRLLKEYAPAVVAHPESAHSIAGIVTDSMTRDTVKVGPRYFATPGLNPAFLRVKESLASLLERPYLNIEESTSQNILIRLGQEFASSLHAAMTLASNSADFSNFIAATLENPFEKAAGRGWIWDDYRADLNRQIYRRLFLHELEGHPEVALPEIYVPSRAIYRDSQERVEGDIDESKRILHCVDLATTLRRNWLDKPTKTAGHSRLVTGDPGTGKSTFSLLFAKDLADEGWRVLFIPANSIRSLGLSLTKIIETHMQRTLRLDQPPNVDQELTDPDATGKPLLIVLDGLDEYDVGGTTVSLAAARLVDHVMTVMDEWCHHDHSVRLLLCGRPEAASSLTRFREVGHHLHVTGFVASKSSNDEFADDKSEDLMHLDQREEWWTKWQSLSQLPPLGLPENIKAGGREVMEITAQPLLNYMLAALQLYSHSDLTNLSALYGTLFARYFERQSQGKSGTFEKICPSLERFQRIMSEIGLAAWHAGDRSVSVEDLQQRFDKPPLKSWFDKAGSPNNGMGAILSAFYTRPEDAADPNSGLAQRYVFTHKSFREYLTGVGITRFLVRLAEQLHPDAENGWSDQDALAHWLALFGYTPLDQRQWEFLKTEFQATAEANPKQFISIRNAVEHLLNLSLKRQMPLPLDATSLEGVLKSVGNAEEAFVGVLSALREAGRNLLVGKSTVTIRWPSEKAIVEGEASDSTALIELLHRIRSRPGSPDEFLLAHVGKLFEEGGAALANQMKTTIRRRSDGWEYGLAFDFTGMDLSDANLSEMDLWFSRFHRATVTGAKFDGSMMRLADMSHVNDDPDRQQGLIPDLAHPILPVSFKGAAMQGTRWTHAALRLVDYSGASLRNADFRGADIDVARADVENAVFGDLVNFEPDEAEDSDSDEAV